ncbi:extracellular solute-binding protein [Gorillibacterium sp. CAU 1737]|uniref:ABC transporter substrate-binding protein n=1 Tax=Gorillibacterium sp. CAU 1737 TaxID=3140362 RepID=UPI003261A57B
MRQVRWFLPRALLLMLGLLLLLTACTASVETVNPIPSLSPTTKPSAPPEGDRKLRIMVPKELPPAWQEELQAMEEQQPIEWLRVDSADANAYLDALAGSNPPDLLLFGASLLGELRGLNVLEDLSSLPYGGFSYNHVFPGLSLDAYKSLDGRRLMAFPLRLSALVTFYRADLVEKAGYPKDPESLGDRLADPEEWVKLGTAAKANGQWIQEKKTDSLDFLMAGQGFFDGDGTFVRSTRELITQLDAVQRAYQAGTAAEWDIGSWVGRNALHQSRFAMLYGAEWKLADLKKLDPEHAEEWQMTRLPFDTYAPGDTLLFAIPSRGSQSEQAWAFATAMLERKEKGESYARQWASRFPPSWPTPLDRKAEKLWRATVSTYLFDESKTSTQAVATGYARTIAELNPDLGRLFEQIRRSSR